MNARAEADRAVLRLATVGAGIALALAALISPYASSRPDGFERVAAGLGIEEPAEAGFASAPLSDYSVPGIQNERTSTAVAGMIGTAVVLAVVFACARVFSRRTPEPGDTA